MLTSSSRHEKGRNGGKTIREDDVGVLTSSSRYKNKQDAAETVAEGHSARSALLIPRNTMAQAPSKYPDLRQKAVKNTNSYSPYLLPTTSQSIISHRAERWAGRRFW